MADTRFFTAIKPTTLSSGTSIGATSITPAFIKDREDNSIATMATYFGTKAYGVIGPNTSREEHFSFTGISAGVLTGVSHVSMVAPYTETSGLSEAHAAGEVVIIQTNSPAFYNELANKQNDETVAGTWTFTETALPRSSASHSYVAGEEEYFATKRYVDGVALSGAPDASTTQKGVVEEATAAELTAGTAAGGTSARLFTNPSTLAAHIQSGAWLFASTGGTASAITATFTPAITALTHGMTLCVHNTTANNAGATFNPNGLGAKALYKYAGGSAIAVEANDMKALYHYILLYDLDADVFLLVNPSNGTLTATAQTEVQNFFSATDITGAEAETLSSSATSDSDSLHTHNRLVKNISVSYAVSGTGALGGTDYACGFSDATTKVFALGAAGGGASGGSLGTFALDPNFKTPYILATPSVGLTKTKIAGGVLAIGSDKWSSTVSGGGIIQKNGSDVTFSGTARTGPLGHNPTTSSLLVLYSTTKIAQFSGISGTTITNLSSDITLDTAVTATVGFLYDNTNSRYICLDTSNNLIRRFNSSGTTVDTLSYTIDDTKVIGLLSDGYRVYIVTQVSGGAEAGGAGSQGSGSVNMFAIPTTMTI